LISVRNSSSAAEGRTNDPVKSMIEAIPPVKNRRFISMMICPLFAARTEKVQRFFARKVPLRFDSPLKFIERPASRGKPTSHGRGANHLIPDQAEGPGSRRRRGTGPSKTERGLFNASACGESSEEMMLPIRRGLIRPNAGASPVVSGFGPAPSRR
jgi:hypothetical protein